MHGRRLTNGRSKPLAACRPCCSCPGLLVDEIKLNKEFFYYSDF